MEGFLLLNIQEFANSAPRFINSLLCLFILYLSVDDGYGVCFFLMVTEFVFFHDVISFGRLFVPAHFASLPIESKRFIFLHRREY